MEKNGTATCSDTVALCYLWALRVGAGLMFLGAIYLLLWPLTPWVKAHVSVSRLVTDKILGEEVHKDVIDTPLELAYARKRVVSHPDWISAPLLVSMRENYPEKYESLSAQTKLSIMCSSVRRARYFDTKWGILDITTQERHKVFREHKKMATACLLKLLEDRRRLGDKESPFNFPRVCDLAYYQLCLLSGESAYLEPLPGRRDEAIREFKRSLLREQGEYLETEEK